MPSQASALTLQFLAWVAGGERTYRNAMDAWRTSCPRLTIWEDALGDGLIEVESNGTVDQARVRITPRGAQLLAARTMAS